MIRGTWPMLAVAAALVVGPALAEEPATVGALELSRRIVASSGTPGEASAGYVRVTGAGAEDQLTAVSCACASRVEFHRIERKASGVDMVADPAWDVPAQGTLDVRPGSDLHFMLIDFDPAQAVNGQVTLTLTLTFRDAGDVQATFVLTADSRSAWAAFD